LDVDYNSQYKKVKENEDMVYNSNSKKSGSGSGSNRKLIEFEDTSNETDEFIKKMKERFSTTRTLLNQ